MENDAYRFGGNRGKVLIRDGYICVICGMTQDEHISRWRRGLTVDHINGKGVNSKVKDNRMSNLRSLCLSCHSKEDRRRTIMSGTHGQLKLNKEKIIIIKRLLAQGLSTYKIGSKFNVSPSLISMVRTGKCWKQLK